MHRSRFHARVLGTALGAGMACQLGGCELGAVTTSVTLDGRELLVSVIRGALLQPLDAFVTGAINNLFDDDE